MLQVSLEMNAISISILVILVAVVLFAPRRWAMLAMAAGTLYLTQGNAIEILGLNLFAVRFLEMASFARVMARREFTLSKLNEMDRPFIILYLYTTIAFVLRSDAGQAYQIGLVVDAILCYLIFRGLIEGMDDLRWFLSVFVILLIPYVALLVAEMHTGQNPFSMLGGKVPTEMLRGDRLRCIGSFRHPSLLGSLGASLLPLYIGLSFSRPRRLYAVVGIIVSLAVVGFSNSGGPLTFAAFGVLGWSLWSFRERMREIRRVAVASIIALALVMKAPIWYLPTHITFLTGGDAWHRSYLIDVAVRHRHEWWLWGMAGSKTSDWFAYALATNAGADITNQFIAFGLSAGLMAIVLFIWLLIRAFRSLGKSLTAVRLASPMPCETEYLLWGLGVMLAGHIANFTAITYFDQFYVIWFMQLAWISTLTHEAQTVDREAPSASIAAPVGVPGKNLVVFDKQ